MKRRRPSTTPVSELVRPLESMEETLIQLGHQRVRLLHDRIEALRRAGEEPSPHLVEMLAQAEADVRVLREGER